MWFPFLVFTCYAAFILLVWFNTSAWVEWMALLKLDKLTGADEYLRDLKQQEHEIDTLGRAPQFSNYLEYLRYKTPESFMVKLITCPICFNTWLTLWLSLYIGFVFWPIMFVLSLFLYFGLVALINFSHRP